jgi:protein-tyrosine-phosphatase
MKIHYICRGNVVRSLIAETYTRSLQLPDIEVSSSGTVADRHRDRDFTIEHRKRTLALLDRHGLSSYAKSISSQISQKEIDKQDLVVCVNQRAYDEAIQLVTLPKHTIVWHIDDIGEGQRILTSDDRTEHEEAIFNEIKASVDELATRIN